MTNDTLFLYKVSSEFEQVLESGGIAYKVINDIYFFEQIDNSTILTCAEVMNETEYLLCRLTASKKITIIAIIPPGFLTYQKEMLFECGVKHFLRNDADIYDLLSVLPCRDPHTKQAVKEALLMPESLINKLSSPIFIKDKNRRYIACNDAFCEHVNKPREAIIGRMSSNLFSNKKSQIFDEIDRIVLEEGQDRQHTGKTASRDNTVHNVIIKKTPLYATDGTIRGLIGVITDVTELKNKEKQHREEKNKAKNSDKLKTSFLSNMSHEIRTPMNAIVGFSQLLTSPSLNDERKKIYIEQINTNADQLLKLIEDIIEVSKIEAGKISVLSEICYINQFLDDIYTSFEAHKGIMGKSGLELRITKAHADKNFTILTDRYRLNQILSNLLANALKFTESGYVEFGYSELEIDNEKHLEFFVKDTGLGIQSEKLPYVFDRFSKIPASKTKLYGGTGIGLSISKSLVELLGGKIYVESEENQGTTFYFTIPVKHAEQEQIDQSVAKKNITTTVEKKYNWSRKNILIAEDEEMNYLYLQEVLKPTNAQVLWAQNGEEAIREIERNPEYDIILMDVRMPKIDGYQATQTIKHTHPEIPIIIQTAYAMPSERETGYASGCDEYIEKPVNRDLLLNLISEYLD